MLVPFSNKTLAEKEASDIGRITSASVRQPVSTFMRYERMLR